MNIKLSDHFTYKKLMRFTLPSIAMMIFTSIYGIVDGYFVSNFVGKTPFAAVNLVWPLIMMLATVGFVFGTGGTAIVAKTMGEGKPEKANGYFSLFVYVTFALSVVLSVCGFIFMRRIASLLGAEGELLECAVVYARIILATLPFYSLQLLFQSFFVTAEKPQLGLIVTVSSGVTNMVFDALLVLLLPTELKLVGAAWATSLSQIVGGAVPIVYFACKNKSLLRLGKTRFDGRAILKATTNGFSEFMSNVSMSLVGMLYNLQLMKYAGENGIAAYGVMMYVSMIFSGTFIGYSIGTAPVIGYHFGAQNKKELKSLLKKSLVLMLVFGIVMALAAQVLAWPLAQIFVGYDDALSKLTTDGFRIFGLSFAFMGFAIFFSGFFTALSDGLTSAAISFLRTLVFQISAVMLLPLIFGINGVWVSIVIAEAMAMVFGFIFKKLKQKQFGY